MKWISVKDELPSLMKNLPYSEDVLVCYTRHGQSTEFGSSNTYEKEERYLEIDRLIMWEGRDDMSFRSDRFYGTVTHWMKLPKVPNEN